jgi:light-regulated signal transduction histidine kinase (bacteriophytochrome)
MTKTPQIVLEEYLAGLDSHLAKADEAELTAAYELGRNALRDGLGVLDLVLLHHAALARVGRPAEVGVVVSKLDRAAEFLAESLSPFEMSMRGYREANALLSGLNESLQQAKAATEAANRELESFSYSVAHDLRAPLRSIDGFSQALLEDCADRLDDDARKHLRYVREAAQEMAALIDGLLSLSRVTRSELHRQTVNLTRLAAAALDQLRNAAPDRRVETVVAPALIAEGDPRLVRSLLDNLLGNAWKFTRKKTIGKIEVGATMRDGHQAFFVRDNGAGFDMAYAAKLFGAFQRLHAAHEFEGTGIGLATVQRIVNRHGGRVWADAEVGRGATFYFTLWDARPDSETDRP